MKKPIVEHLGYYAGEDGYIYSKKKGILKQLKPQKQPNGYYKVDLYNDKKRSREYIHRLVAETFSLMPTGDLEINHIDADKSNNSTSNLEAVTHQENMDHAKSMGLCHGIVGEANTRSRLTEKMIGQARLLLSIGFTYTAIADLCNVHRTTISGALQGRTWKHLQGRIL